MGHLKVFCVFLIIVIQSAFSFPKGKAETGKTSKGCVNSCCAVCIPGKNCEVCYQLNRSDPGNCPCISELSDSQKISIKRFQKYFTGKLSQQKDKKSVATNNNYLFRGHFVLLNCCQALVPNPV